VARSIARKSENQEVERRKGIVPSTNTDRGFGKHGGECLFVQAWALRFKGADFVRYEPEVGFGEMTVDLREARFGGIGKARRDARNHFRIADRDLERLQSMDSEISQFVR